VDRFLEGGCWYTVHCGYLRIRIFWIHCIVLTVSLVLVHVYSSAWGRSIKFTDLELTVTSRVTVHTSCVVLAAVAHDEVYSSLLRTPVYGQCSLLAVALDPCCCTV